MISFNGFFSHVDLAGVGVANCFEPSGTRAFDPPFIATKAHGQRMWGKCDLLSRVRGVLNYSHIASRVTSESGHRHDRCEV